MNAFDTTDDATDCRSAELFFVASVLVTTTMFNPAIGLVATVSCVGLGAVASRHGKTLLPNRPCAVADLVAPPPVSVIEAPVVARVAPQVVDDLFERVLGGDTIAESQLRILSMLCPNDVRLRRLAHHLDAAKQLTPVG